MGVCVKERWVAENASNGEHGDRLTSSQPDLIEPVTKKSEPPGKSDDSLIHAVGNIEDETDRLR